MQSKGSYRLTVRQGPLPGKLIELAKESLTLGRDVNNDIVVNDAEVSRTHARLTRQMDGYVIEDLGSTNGTFINGQRLTGPKLLRAGDMLGLGETVVMEVNVMRDPEATVVVPPSATAAPVMGSAPSAPAEPPAPPPRPAPVVTGPFSSPPTPEPPAPPIQNNRTLLWVGIACGCLVFLCACAVVAGAVALALNPDLLGSLGLGG
jgi:pSer/pThr/pTyr-binding forkhead associated (FHA) protein